MKYTRKEAEYFYWHCTIAALLIEILTERNRATLSHIQRAIRMASETAVGKAGVQYASEMAYKQKPATKKHWSGLGLTREHVVPVTVIVKKVMDAHDSNTAFSWRDLVRDRLTQDDLQHWKVVDSDYFLDSAAPLSAVIANVVRRYAILAWITKDEDRRLKNEGLTKSMPPSFGEDDLARYKACKISIVPLHATAAQPNNSFKPTPCRGSSHVHTLR